ncbi:MAG: FAD-binding protein, partial [Acidimicrobiales bacterium]
MDRGPGTSALAGLCAALLPPEAGGPDPAAVAGALGAFLARQPRLLSAAAHAGALGIEALSVIGSGARLQRRSPDEREALLRRLAAMGPLGPGLDGLKALVLLVHGAGAAADATRAAATAGDPARPDAELHVTRAGAWPGSTRADVVVVGSGAGGAMVARTLARAGLEVVVVEEGRRHGVEEFRTGHPLERFAEL